MTKQLTGKKEKKFTIKEVEKAMMAVLPAFPKRKLLHKIAFVSRVWQLTKVEEELNDQ